VDSRASLAFDSFVLFLRECAQETHNGIVSSVAVEHDLTNSMLDQDHPTACALRDART
jgi:hypothetical protein